VEAIVPSVDIEAGIVHITPPDGLFEETEPDDEPGDRIESLEA
jgi:16S rRNA processing protein RimM